MVYGVGLENRRGSNLRGFKSYRLRCFTWKVGHSGLPSGLLNRRTSRCSPFKSGTFRQLAPVSVHALWSGGGMNHRAVALSMVLVACAGSHRGQPTCPIGSPTVNTVTDSGVSVTPPNTRHRHCRCRSTGLDGGVGEGGGEPSVESEFTCIIPLLDRAQEVMDRLSGSPMDVPRVESGVPPTEGDAGAVGPSLP